ncbi:MAG: hypothetical protein RLZZ385_1016 [Pseudomonadota bacterium]|jgi:hypothetical protein
MSNEIKRRAFLQSGALIATSVAAGLAGSSAMAQDVNVVVLSSRTVNLCGTCVYWGGQRTISEDRNSVMVHSFGVCNNRNSPMYRTTTSPEHGPMDVWEKWPALD